MNNWKTIFYRRSASLLSCVLVALAALATGIYAYFADADRMANAVGIGGCNVEIQEDFEPPQTLDKGGSFKKDVSVKNMGPGNCYVRVKAVFSNSDMEACCSVDWNTTDWVYDTAEDYYYYPVSLKEGESTDSLFTTVSWNDNLPDQIRDFDIIVYAEGYQAHPFENYQEAWEHFHRNQ